MLSQKYHKIFDYQLVKSDYPRWRHTSDKGVTGIASIKSITRKKREQISKQKLIIAKKASKILSKIPTVKFVGVTGSLAMMNANINSDIDLMIITKSGSLWTTRLLCYYLLITNRYLLRRPKLKKERDMLCINMWLDETDLVWDKKDRNVYTAHEIAQVVPMVNKDKIYEKFQWQNKWVLDFWPNAVRVTKIHSYRDIKNINLTMSLCNYVTLLFEKIAYKLQYYYMAKKITREIVTPTRAIFHPNDWGKVVIEKLKD